MKTNLFSSFVLMLIVATTFMGCKTKDNTTPVKAIPPIISEQLLKSKANLALYSQTLQIVDYEYYETIGTESEKSSLVEQLTNPKSSWYGCGNLLAATSVMISPLEDFTKDTIAQVNLKTYIENRIFIGNQVVKINWLYAGKQFSTYCIINDTSIIWDNVLKNLLMVVHHEPVIKSTSNAGQASAYDNTYSEWWTAYWLYGTMGGEMGYNITIHCSSSTNVTSTDVSDWGWINLGNVLSESKVIHNSGAYGQIQFALGMSTPLMTLTFADPPFIVTVSGLGGNVVENGTKSLYP
jgi:hypothetical protein